MIIAELIIVGLFMAFGLWLAWMDQPPEADRPQPMPQRERTTEEILRDLEWTADELRRTRPKLVLFGPIPVYRPRTKEDGDAP